MFDRLRQSLALRLAVQYALVFTLASALLFGLLYRLLADALDARERRALEQRAENFAAAYERGGAAGVIGRVSNDTSADLPALFIRLTAPNNTVIYNKWPADWVETQVQTLPIPGWALKRENVRIPQNAQRDYTIVSRQLPNGWVLHVGRLLDSRPVLLAPLKRTFLRVGIGAFALSIGLGLLLAY